MLPEGDSLSPEGKQGSAREQRAPAERGETPTNDMSAPTPPGAFRLLGVPFSRLPFGSPGRDFSPGNHGT